MVDGWTMSVGIVWGGQKSGRASITAKHRKSPPLVPCRDSAQLLQFRPGAHRRAFFSGFIFFYTSDVVKARGSSF